MSAQPRVPWWPPPDILTEPSEAFYWWLRCVVAGFGLAILVILATMPFW